MMAVCIFVPDVSGFESIYAYFVCFVLDLQEEIFFVSFQDSVWSFIVVL